MAQSPLTSPSTTSPGSALLPQGGGGGGGGEAPPSIAQPPPPPSFPAKMLSQAQGRYNAVNKAAKALGRVQTGLDALRDLGDSVTQDDVMDEMSDLIAHGADPKTLAAMIAGNSNAGVGPMPPGGQPLEGWLVNVESQMIAPAEAQLRPALALAQHQLGVAAMHRIVELGQRGRGGGGSAAPSAPPSPSPTAPGSPLLQ